MNDYYVSRVENLKGIKARTLTKDDIDKDGLGIVGNTYYNGYWNECYKIIDRVKDNIFGECVVCEWEDKRKTTHCTRIDLRHDLLVIGA